jgi:tRNA-dihydrouridine synthase
MYEGKADWSIIKDVKEAVTIPVIGNGDVTSALEARRMLDETGCDAIMIGRGVLGNPWLIKEIAHYLETGVILDKPTEEIRIELAMDHLERLIELKGERLAMLEMRGHASWYIKGLPHATAVKKRINTCKDLDDLRFILREYLKQLIEEREEHERSS